MKCIGIKKAWGREKPAQVAVGPLSIGEAAATWAAASLFAICGEGSRGNEGAILGQCLTGTSLENDFWKPMLERSTTDLGLELNALGNPAQKNLPKRSLTGCFISEIWPRNETLPTSASSSSILKRCATRLAVTSHLSHEGKVSPSKTAAVFSDATAKLHGSEACVGHNH